MTTLVVGASGATGRLLVQQLLERGERVRAIVRSREGLPDSFERGGLLERVEASILELSDDQLAAQVRGCDAVASCLGHNMSARGIFGPPWRLVTEATRRLCDAIRANEPETPRRFVLMNTAGNRNRDLDEPVSLAQAGVTGLLRLLVPPHRDNEAAAEYLRVRIGRGDEAIRWVVVRPDGLTDEPEIAEYELHPSPTRSAIFDPGVTRRVQVARFMADLIMDDATWARWEGQMPVIYDAAPGAKAGSRAD